MGFAQSDEVGGGITAKAVWSDPLMVAVPSPHPLLKHTDPGNIRAVKSMENQRATCATLAAIFIFITRSAVHWSATLCMLTGPWQAATWGTPDPRADWPGGGRCGDRHR